MKRGPSGRYSDPVEREQLIQRLLRERDQTRQRATVSMENNETFHDNNSSSNGKPDCNIYLSMTIKDC